VRAFLFAVLLFSFLNYASGGTEQEIAQADEELRQAFLHADAAALNRMLADDWRTVHVNGRQQNKTQFIESLTSGRAKFLSIEIDEKEVRVYGETAVETARWTNTVEFKGQRNNGQDRVTRVWVKRPEGWRVVTEQAAFIEPAPTPAVPSADEKEILRLEEVIKEAWLKHDGATISSVYADDFQSWSFKGMRRGKADLLKAVASNGESDTKVEEPSVRVVGDAAIYTTRIVDSGRNNKGEPFSVTTCLTSVFTRRNGKWQVVAEHQSKVDRSP
jgi:ketosteroid isomerase-like protein